MNFDPNIHAELVYDGGDTVHVPERLGKPNPDQLQGTPLEQLAELAGRVCYDSLGVPKARGSAAYHAHIREVGHRSVYEHAVRTVELTQISAFDVVHVLMGLLNRPGVFVRESTDSALRLTLNLRSLLEWNRYPEGVVSYHAVLGAFAPCAPTVLDDLECDYDPSPGMIARVAEPVSVDEKWITLLLCGSRGMSHELVRHGDFTAISQRSTRYVDESESVWVEHPLVSKILRPPIDGTTAKHRLMVDAGNVKHDARSLYVGVVEALEPSASRKQARGAARGFLGNALYTEVMFSASVRQWRYMLQARCSDAADAEIRVLFARALTELQRSRHGDCFADLRLRPAQDGIGEVLDS